MLDHFHSCRFNCWWMSKNLSKYKANIQPNDLDVSQTVWSWCLVFICFIQLIFNRKHQINQAWNLWKMHAKRCILFLLLEWDLLIFYVHIFQGFYWNCRNTTFQVASWKSSLNCINWRRLYCFVIPYFKGLNH